MKIVNCKLKIMVFVVFFLWSIVYIPKSIYAQQVSLGIYPPLLDAVIKPGKSILIAYRVHNFGDPVILKARVMPFEPKDNLGNIKIASEFTGPVRFSLDNANLKLNDAFFLKTQDSEQLLLRIRIPEGAPEGDYYYTLLVETQPAPTQEGITASRATATIGSNILITVTETGLTDVKAKIALFDLIPRLKLNLFGKQYRIVDSNDTIPLILVVQNNGKNRIRPQGSITLQGNFGEKATFDLLPQNILSQSQRLIAASESSSIERNPTHTMELSGFFIGSYKLSTGINFGEGTPTIFGSTGFIAIPFRFILGGCAALLAGLLIIKWLKERQTP